MKNDERLCKLYNNRPSLLKYKQRIAQVGRGWGEWPLLPYNENIHDDFTEKNDEELPNWTRQRMYESTCVVPYNKRVKIFKREHKTIQSTQLFPQHFAIVKHSQWDRFVQTQKNRRNLFLSKLLVCFGGICKLSNDLFDWCNEPMFEIDVRQLKKTESNLADFDWEDIFGE